MRSSLFASTPTTLLEPRSGRGPEIRNSPDTARRSASFVRRSELIALTELPLGAECRTPCTEPPLRLLRLPPSSVQAALLDHDVLSHNQPMGCHFSQLGQNAVDVLIGIDEGDHDGQLPSSFDQMRGMDAAPSEKAGYGVVGHGSEGILFAQIFQDFQMQWAMMPGIAFGEVDGDLNGHIACHFTTPSPRQRQPERRPGRARCWPQC